MLIKRASRSILCKKLQDDILNFCIFNPFRLSKALLNLYFKYYSYKSINFNFHKKFKIFYKKIITTFGRNKLLTYFLKIKFFKKKLMIFFGYSTFKQLSMLFNSVYNQKTFFRFKDLLNFLEMRVDILIFRLRVCFSLYDSREFIDKYGLLVNWRLIKNFFFHVKIGDYVSLKNLQRNVLFNKFYRLWFNELIYSNKFLKFKIFYKITYLKVFIKRNLKKKITLKKKLNVFILSLKQMIFNQQKRKIGINFLVLKEKFNFTLKFLFTRFCNFFRQFLSFYLKYFSIFYYFVFLNIFQWNIIKFFIFYRNFINYFPMLTRYTVFLTGFFNFNFLSYKLSYKVLSIQFFRKLFAFFNSYLDFFQIKIKKFKFKNRFFINKQNSSKTITILHNKVLSKKIIFYYFFYIFFKK
jgi:hypothetical protein